MDFGVEGERQRKDVLEITHRHGQPAPVRDTICAECQHEVGQNSARAYEAPCAECGGAGVQRFACRPRRRSPEHVDQAPEQDRLDEEQRCDGGVRDGEHHDRVAFWRQQAQRANIDLDESQGLQGHFSADSADLLMFFRARLLDQVSRTTMQYGLQALPKG